MITDLAAYLTSRLRDMSVIPEEDRELYQYGLFILLSGLFHFLVTLVYGAILGVLWESVLLYLLFTPLRGYAGGFHAKTETQCLVLTDIALLACVLGIRLLKGSQGLLVPALLAAVGTACVFLLSPLDSQEKPLDPAERKKYGKLSRWTALGILALGILTWVLGIPGVLHSAAMCFALESLLLILGKGSQNSRSPGEETNP